MALITASGSGSSSSSPAHSSPPKHYDVFLSFSGKDTRRSFTDHLYTALGQKGIVAFRDNDELEPCEAVKHQLMKAIEASQYAIVVLSQTYASSSWCLDELQKIVDLGRPLYPVFYGVNPSDFRYQKENIATAFEKHEQRFSKDRVQKWREALTKVANISGCDTRGKHEARIVEDIVQLIWNKVCAKLPSNFEHLIGIQSKVDNMISLLKIGLDDISFIGIWGMGGIGKTTLARVVYEAIQGQFEISCFLANVREESEKSSDLVDLQKKLLSCLHLRNIGINNSYEGVKMIRRFLCEKKVLIVLDDVSDISQLKNLAGNKSWFGAGSRIIITTRDIHLLAEYKSFEQYNVEMLNNDESLKLLSRNAFNKDYPEEDYMELSQKVVQYAGGLPLALQVLGSFLCKRSQSEWKDALDKLKQNLDKDIFKLLRISFDGLKDEEFKMIFLDIACFFNWEEKIKVTKILKNCGLHSTIGIPVLIEKSLLKVRKNGPNGKEILYMHDLLQEMGRKIVVQDSPNDASKQSRLWSQKEIDRVLKRNKGTENVQSMSLKLRRPYKANWHPDCFSKMYNLRLLYLSKVHLLCSLSSLPSALQVLIWDEYHLEALPHIDELDELVDLKLCRSKIRQLWNGAPILNELKFIDLSNSEDLIETPELSGAPNLESLVLVGCTSLVKVHESLWQLKKLVKLNLANCKNLETIPRKLEMSSLEEFDLFGCSKLEKLPEFGKNMKSLSIFNARETNIGEVPSSILHLTNLKELSFGRYSKSEKPILDGPSLVDSLSGLSSLRKLDLSFFNLCDGSISDDLSPGLSSLMSLDLRGNNFSNLPSGCISNLLNLQYLDVSCCNMLQSMPHLPPNLCIADASLCPSMQPLSHVQHLFASLLSKRQSPHLRELIFLNITGDEIPTWFTEQELHIDYVFGLRPNVCITVDTPCVGDESEWFGIAVCLIVKCRNGVLKAQSNISWSFRALDVEDKGESFGGSVFDAPHLYITFFPVNTQKFCQLGIGERNKLVLNIRIDGALEIKDFGCRLICKKDFEVASFEEHPKSIGSLGFWGSPINVAVVTSSIDKMQQNSNANNSGTADEQKLPHKQLQQLYFRELQNKLRDTFAHFFGYVPIELERVLHPKVPLLKSQFLLEIIEKVDEMVENAEVDSTNRKMSLLKAAILEDFQT